MPRGAAVHRGCSCAGRRAAWTEAAEELQPAPSLHRAPAGLRDVPEVRHLFRPRTCPARSILRFLPLRAEAEPGTEVGDPPRALIWSRGVRV